MSAKRSIFKREIALIYELKSLKKNKCIEGFFYGFYG